MRISDWSSDVCSSDLVSIPAPIDGPDFDEQWATTLAVNLTAHTTTIRACLAHLRRNGDGRIVNIASTEGIGGSAYVSPYTASKHGVIGLSRSLAVELGPTGVTVNVVCPGPIHTGMTAAIPDAAQRSEEHPSELQYIMRNS